MMDDARAIAHRLAAFSDAFPESADPTEDVDKDRHRASVAALGDCERAKLADSLSREDRTVIAWTLRSVADMMKGLITIGAEVSRGGMSVAMNAQAAKVLWERSTGS